MVVGCRAFVVSFFAAALDDWPFADDGLRPDACWLPSLLYSCVDFSPLLAIFERAEFFSCVQDEKNGTTTTPAPLNMKFLSWSCADLCRHQAPNVGIFSLSQAISYALAALFGPSA